MPLMEDFCKDPLAFGRRMSIELRGGGLDWSPEDERLKQVEEAMFQVADRERVLWFTVADDDAYPGTARVRFAYDKAEGYLPTFYLPWFQNHLYSISLEPLEDLEVDYFFTAPVDGCSVYVEGETTAPTVYHANAVDFPQSIYNAKTQYEFQKFLSKRTEFMDEGMKSMSSKVSKVSKKTPPARSVTIEEYQSRSERSDLFPEFGESERRQVRQMLGQRGKVLIGSDSVTVTKRLGTIFGKRTEGEWRFFLQSRVYVDRIVNDYKHGVSKQGYLRYAASWLNPFDYGAWWNQSTRKESYSFPRACGEFWPEGGGRLVYK